MGAGIATLDLISNDTSLRDKLEANTKLFRQRMKEAGFTIKGDDHPISPVMLGDARTYYLRHICVYVYIIVFRLLPFVTVKWSNVSHLVFLC